MYLHAIAIYF